MERLLAQQHRDGVHGRIDRVDPGRVGLDNLLAGHLPGPDDFG